MNINEEKQEEPNLSSFKPKFISKKKKDVEMKEAKSQVKLDYEDPEDETQH